MRDSHTSSVGNWRIEFFGGLAGSFGNVWQCLQALFKKGCYGVRGQSGMTVSDMSARQIGYILDGRIHNMSAKQIGYVLQGRVFNMSASQVGYVLQGRIHNMSARQIGYVLHGRIFNMSARQVGYLGSDDDDLAGGAALLLELLE